MIATQDITRSISAAEHTCSRLLSILRTYEQKTAAAGSAANQLEVAEQALSAVGQQALMLHRHL